MQALFNFGWGSAGVAQSGQMEAQAVFTRKSKTKDAESPLAVAAIAPPLFTRPKITLIDMDKSVQEALAAKGYDSRVVSFGKRFRVQEQPGSYPLEFPAGIERLAEDDIIVVDLRLAPPETEPKLEPPPDGVDRVWANMSHGVIDPRPLAMAGARSDFERILDYGGVFLCFVDLRLRYEFKRGHKEHRDLISTQEPWQLSTWGMLHVLDSNEWIGTKDDDGNVIEISSSLNIAQLLQKHLKDCQFHCNLSRGWKMKEEQWTCLAKNKHGHCVAAAIWPEHGSILLLPDIADKGAFVSEFIAVYLPELHPNLFPESAGRNWLRKRPYEFEDILALEDERLIVAEQAKLRDRELTKKIESARDARALEYGLLTESGSRLVESVVDALRQLGFAKVVNVDEETKKKSEKSGFLAEDIQIMDIDPVLLVEVKGIGGLPADEDILAAQKYLAPRMKEWRRTDLKALCVINHQRHLPPLQRENKSLMRADLETNAVAHEIGVITTWDLFRLLRSMKDLGWAAEDVHPIFKRDGRIQVVPEHYEFVGTVDRFMDGICGIKVEEGSVSVGDILGFDLPTHFVEQEANRIEVDNKPVEIARVGNTFGLKTSLSKAEIFGATVYRSKKSAAG